MKKTALLFRGQGSQYVGMGRRIYQNHTVVKEVFEEAGDVLGFNIRKLCFEVDLQELSRTENTQPAILTLSVALLKYICRRKGLSRLIAQGTVLGNIQRLFVPVQSVLKMRYAL